MLSCYCKGGEDMQIQPNSIIKLCSGVPIDSSYKDTIYFASRSAQKSYFDSKVSKTMDKASFQRINGQQGVVRMSASAESIYNCNYMMFQNTNYGSKWFYAFITNIEYVNDKVSNVYFTIDVMQTWFLFDCTLKESFVEREHHASDTFNDWVIDENLPTGQMQYDQVHHSGLFNEWRYCCLSPYDVSQNLQTKAVNYCGIISPSTIYSFTEVNEFMSYLRGLSDKGVADSVISCFMIPERLLTSRNVDLTRIPIDAIEKNKPTPFSCRKPSTKIGTYTPKNKKLFSYPYCYLSLTNGSGVTNEYRWELFERDTDNPFVTFEVYADFINGYYMATPLNYNGSSSNQTSANGDSNNAFNFSLDFHCSPQLPWISDTYKIYSAQNKVTMDSQVGYGLAQIQTGIMSAIGSGGMSAPISGGLVLSGFNTVRNVMLQNEHAKRLPVGTHGGGGNNSMFDANFNDFYWCNTHVQPEIAKSIDDYFTMFGYATKQVKVPNINVRPHWTYTKTIDCNVISNNCNSNDITAIKNIFDNGITFWKNASEIGNYSLDNSPN